MLTFWSDNTWHWSSADHHTIAALRELSLLKG
jgi:hypothetical protein